MSIDRPMSPKEWAEVEKQINEVREQEALEEMGHMLITQKETISVLQRRIKEQALYIKMLDQVSTERQEKMAQLEETLTKLEKELIQLRCLSNESK